MLRRMRKERKEGMKGTLPIQSWLSSLNLCFQGLSICLLFSPFVFVFNVTDWVVLCEAFQSILYETYCTLIVLSDTVLMMQWLQLLLFTVLSRASATVPKNTSISKFGLMKLIG